MKWNQLDNEYGKLSTQLTKKSTPHITERYVHTKTRLWEKKAIQNVAIILLYSKSSSYPGEGDNTVLRSTFFTRTLAGRRFKYWQ